MHASYIVYGADVSIRFFAFVFISFSFSFVLSIFSS